MMKKFIAVFLMMVYGFTSVNASVAIHQCGMKLPSTAHHQKSGSSLHQSSSCDHQQFHLTSNCCTGSVEVCTTKTDDNLSETASNKSFNYQPVIFYSSYNEAQACPYTFQTASVRPLVASSYIHKLRLHLYNRILLI